MKYENQNNYVKLEKLSKVIEKIKLTDKQRVLIDDLMKEIVQINTSLKSFVDIDKKIFIMPLLLLEGESSSLIEGTRSMYEDFSYDYEEINNIPQWETRNLINLYEKYLLDSYYSTNIPFTLGTIINMHIELFEINQNSKFKMTYDTSNRIKQVKPGIILKDDSKPNFIGNSNDITKSNLILLKPSLKKDFLEDWAETLENKLNEKSLLIDHIILSHPIFEAIHPFKDGNGRLGRILISLLFSKKWPDINIPIYISEAFNEEKEVYKEKLLNVQIKNDYDSWNNWISFFIDCLIKTKRKLEIRTTKIRQIWNKYKDTKAMSTPIRKEITESFFKYYKVNKPLTIKILIQKYSKVSVQTIYKDFETVVSILNVSNENNDYYNFDELLKIIRLK